MGHIHDNSSKVLSSAASAHLTCFCQCTIFQIINLSVLSLFCISLLCFTFNSVHSLRSLWHRYSNWRPLYSPSILTSSTIFYILHLQQFLHFLLIMHISYRDEGTEESPQINTTWFWLITFAIYGTFLSW